MGRRKRKKKKPARVANSPAVPVEALVDALVDDLRGDTTAEAGEFTLDRSVALEKLRRFQLAEPREYVVELVQAASLKGATWIDFRVDTDDLWMRFDGHPFGHDELLEVYSAVFRRDQDEAVRAQQQLALGLNAALALAPRFIRVTSGTGDNRVQLDIRKGSHEVSEQAGSARSRRVGHQDVTSVTTIHVKAPWRPALIRRFVKNLRRTLPEEQILRRRARYASLDIQVNGREIAEGLHLPDAEHEVEYERDGLRVICGLVPGYVEPRVLWVTNGALVTTTELKGRTTEGFVAVVEGSGLRTDVSRANIVQDALHETALKLVDRGRGRLKNHSDAQWWQANERYKNTRRAVHEIYTQAASRYETLHLIGERALKVGYAMIVINMFLVAFLTTIPEDYWGGIFVPIFLLVASFSAPTLCGRAAGRILARTHKRYRQRFGRGNPERRDARRVLQECEDTENGTLAEDMQRRR